MVKEKSPRPGEVLFNYLEKVKVVARYPLDDQNFEYYVLGMAGEVGEVSDLFAQGALQTSLKTAFDLVHEMGDWVFYAIVAWYKSWQLTRTPDGATLNGDTIRNALFPHYEELSRLRVKAREESQSVRYVLFFKLVADSGRVADMVKKSRRLKNPRLLNMRECQEIVSRAIATFEFLCLDFNIELEDICEASIDKIELKRLREEKAK